MKRVKKPLVTVGVVRKRTFIDQERKVVDVGVLFVPEEWEEWEEVEIVIKRVGRRIGG